MKEDVGTSKSKKYVNNVGMVLTQEVSVGLYESGLLILGPTSTF